jgi:hypothetical protein
MSSALETWIDADAIPTATMAEIEALLDGL